MKFSTSCLDDSSRGTHLWKESGKIEARCLLASHQPRHIVNERVNVSSLRQTLKEWLLLRVATEPGCPSHINSLNDGRGAIIS